MEKKMIVSFIKRLFGLSTDKKEDVVQVQEESKVSEKEETPPLFPFPKSVPDPAPKQSFGEGTAMETKPVKVPGAGTNPTPPKSSATAVSNRKKRTPEKKAKPVAAAKPANNTKKKTK